MNKKQTIIITALSLAVLVLALLVSTRLWFRLDLTKNKTYTISAVSRKVARELPSELRVTYFVSDKLKTTYPNPGEIEDILREYAAHSRGKMRVSVKDPAKSGMEATVEELGIQGQQIQVVEKNQATIAVVYSGILLEYLDKSDVVGFAFSTETLEYDLTSRIRALLTENERRIGIAAAEGRTLDNDFSYLRSALEQAGFKVSEVTPSYEVPDTLPALFVFAGADSLSQEALYRIDRYIRLGGRVLFAADGLMINTSFGMQAYPLEDSALLKMLAGYGVTVENKLVLDMSSNIVQYASNSYTGRQVYELIRYPFWLSVPPEYGSRLSPLTASFNGIDLYWASPLILSAPDGIEAEALFTSTEESWLQTENFNIDPSQSWAFTYERDASLGEKTLAASLSGIFPGYYSEKPAPEEVEGAENEGGAEPSSLPDMPDEAKESRIIVLGDSDLALNQNIGQTQSRRTLDFFVTCAGWLSNDDDIIGIRSRSGGSGRLDRIVDEEKRIAAMGSSQIFGTFVLPALVVVLAVLALGLRKKREIAGNAEKEKETSNV